MSVALLGGQDLDGEVWETEERLTLWITPSQV
jgi:hypothetical protein